MRKKIFLIYLERMKTEMEGKIDQNIDFKYSRNQASVMGHPVTP